MSSGGPSGDSRSKLNQENIKLKQDLEDLKSQYQQLLNEGSGEKYDEKRVNLLKAQVMQLERQVILLAEGLSSQASRHLEVETLLQSFNDKISLLITYENQSPEIVVSRSELKELVDLCGKIRQKLHRNNKVANLENLSMPWLIPGKDFTKQEVTLLELCYGKVNNLNLQKVSALESKLTQLYGQLCGMKETVSFLLAPGPDPPEQARHVLMPSAYARLLNQLNCCSKALEDSCLDLLTLSLIVPSAPWARTEQQVIQELTVESVLSVLPAVPKGAPQQRAKRAAEALVKTANYSRLMALQQVQALEAELEFHRSMYSFQIKYTEDLIQGIRKAYRTFQKDVAETLCSPLEDVLLSYSSLKITTSESALRDFLTAFKNRSEQIQDAVEALKPSNNEGDEALSKFGKQFFRSLEQLLKECSEQRDRASWELETLKAEYDQACESLSSLTKERKEKSTDSSHHSQKSEAGSTEGGEGDNPTAVEKPTSVTTSAGRESMPKTKLSTLRMAKVMDTKAPVSDDGTLGERKVTQGLSHLSRGKSPHRSKSMKNVVRPPWQT
ncbi:uncharacterized protein LOC114654898 [Erpetoichthys calabaricus]|uniref:uncharacterized protein LOC114654898 n=1 Tax=Erpetoichthys calabaricus TaxID=27687 RepID=UPI00109F3024|nr:uncharacterized protein LOC114654898 [Erpetoichthys calabaricus]